MRTYRISEEEIKGMKPVAVGYKAFPNNFVSHGYDFKDENGNIVGTIHKVDFDIAKHQWGLHFSEFPQDCFNFYAPLQWNKFAKVEAYDKVIRKNARIVTNIIKIVKVYSFDEFIYLIQQSFQYDSVNESFGVHCSSGIRKSNGVDWSRGVYLSDGVDNSSGVNWSAGVKSSKGVNRSNGVNESNGVNWGYGIRKSDGVDWSRNVNLSNGVSGSKGVNLSNGVENSRGVNLSNGVNKSYGITNCEAVSNCIFCFNQKGAKFKLFNKKVAEARINEVFSHIRDYGWYPKFNNAEELKGNLEWYETNISAIVNVPNKIAWSFMPDKMKQYIQSLPEYSEKIFRKVTGKIHGYD